MSKSSSSPMSVLGIVESVALSAEPNEFDKARHRTNKERSERARRARHLAKTPHERRAVVLSFERQLRAMHRAMSSVVGPSPASYGRRSDLQRERDCLRRAEEALAFISTLGVW